MIQEIYQLKFLFCVTLWLIFNWIKKMQKTMATHGEYWLLFIQISQVLVYILNLCHKNKLNWGGETKLQEYELMND